MSIPPKLEREIDEEIKGGGCGRYMVIKFEGVRDTCHRNVLEISLVEDTCPKTPVLVSCCLVVS